MLKCQNIFQQVSECLIKGLSVSLILTLLLRHDTGKSHSGVYATNKSFRKREPGNYRVESGQE